MTTQPHQFGFTLIEMIVALGLFSVVTTITTGAMLMLVSANQKFHFEQNIMTNLSFAVDSMTREMRTGFNYYCASGALPSEAPFGGAQHENTQGEVVDLGQTAALRRDCDAGRGNSRLHGVSFYESGESVTGPSFRRILYFYDATEQMIYRRVGNNDPEPIVSSGVNITSADFFVRDSSPLLIDATLADNDADQPSVTLYLTAEAADDTATTPRSFTVQTTVSQRSLDL